jgi:SAM-dependent methyltransferase
MTLDSEAELQRIATTIQRGEHGIWIAETSSAVSYPEGGNDLYFEVEEKSFWFQHRNRCLVEVMDRFPPPGTFWDIGGGNGFVSLAVQNKWPVVLVEPGPSGALNARRRGVQAVLCSTLEDAGLKAGSIQAAGAFDVVEHIADDLAFVRSIARSLAPGGRFYLTVPAFTALWSHEDNDAGHFRRYTTARLRGVLEKGGFEVEYLTYFFQFLPLPILLLRTLPYRLGLRNRKSETRTASEHNQPGGLLQPVFDGILSRERELIRHGKTMAFGGSCLAVAKKI